MLIVGHRGCSGSEAENTLAAFKKALDFKVDEIEFDLRVTVDNQVVISHDPIMLSKAGLSMQIELSNLSELRSIKPDLATFDEIIDLTSRHTVLYIEIKPGVAVEPIIDIIEDRLGNGWQAGDFRVASFDQKVLEEVKLKLPGIALIVLENWSSLRAHLRCKRLETNFVAMNQKWLWGGFIRSVTRRGWRLYAYTLNDPSKAKAWQAAGLYAIITDYPERFETKVS
jgi:glycerophosphoryl diester phosphodiesterase